MRIPVLLALLSLLSPLTSSAEAGTLSFLCRIVGNPGSFQAIACSDYIDALMAMAGEDREVAEIIERATELRSFYDTVPGWPLEAADAEERQFFEQWLAWSQDTMERDLARLNEIVLARQQLVIQAHFANTAVQAVIERLDASERLLDLPKAAILRELALVDIPAEQARLMVWVALQSEMNQLASDYYGAEIADVEPERVTLVNGRYSLEFDDGVGRSTLWSLQFEYDESGQLTHIRHTDRDIVYECEDGVCTTEPNANGIVWEVVPSGHNLGVRVLNYDGDIAMPVRACP